MGGKKWKGGYTVCQHCRGSEKGWVFNHRLADGSNHYCNKCGNLFGKKEKDKKPPAKTQNWAKLRDVLPKEYWASVEEVLPEVRLTEEAPENPVRDHKQLLTKINDLQQRQQADAGKLVDLAEQIEEKQQRIQDTARELLALEKELEDATKRTKACMGIVPQVAPAKPPEPVLHQPPQLDPDASEHEIKAHSDWQEQWQKVQAQMEVMQTLAKQYDDHGKIRVLAANQQKLRDRQRASAEETVPVPDSKHQYEMESNWKRGRELGAAPAAGAAAAAAASDEGALPTQDCRGKSKGGGTAEQANARPDRAQKAADMLAAITAKVTGPPSTDKESRG